MKQLLIVNLILTDLGLSVQRTGKVTSKDTISITDMEPKEIIQLL
jgi:hypothetical protein